MVKVKENLIGRQFGKLIVISRDDDYVSPSGNRQARWICRCECGNIITQITSNLKKVVSCGCYRNEKLSQYRKQYNTYDLSGEYGIGYTLKGEEFWFDIEDYDKIKDYCWYYNDSGYVMAYDFVLKTYVRLHRLVMNCVNCEFDIDHKTHPPRFEKKIDNRKSNLRIVTHSENMMNASMGVNNTSGCKGVSFDKNRNQWMAYIILDGEQINLGRFKHKDEAIRVRKQAEITYFKDKRYDQYN